MDIKTLEADYDRCVGKNIARLRKASSMSQQVVGDALGITFQQVQKIEQGRNRIGAGRLLLLSQFLGCQFADFFRSIDGQDSSEFSSKQMVDVGHDPFQQELFERLSDLPPKAQAALLALLNEILDLQDR